MTPKEKAEELLVKYDMIIYTDQNSEEQVLRCSIRDVKNTIEELDDMYSLTEDGSLMETILGDRTEYFKYVLLNLESRLKKLT